MRSTTRSISRWGATASLLVALAFLLSACVQVDRSVTLNSDGSGSYTLSIGLSAQVLSVGGSQLSERMNDFGATVEQQGGAFRFYTNNGYSYWVYTRPFQNVAQLNALAQQTPQAADAAGAIASLPSIGQETLNFTRQTGFLSATFHVTGTLSLSAAPGSQVNPSLEPYLSQMRASFAVTMPDAIISHSGGAQHGNTVTYTVRYGQTTAIDVVGGGLDSSALATLGAWLAVALFVLAALIFAWWWLRRRGAGRAAVVASVTTAGIAPAQSSPPLYRPADADAPTTPMFGAQTEPGDAPERPGR